jgi:hypothetical protein
MRVWVGGRGEGLCEGGVEGIEWSGIKGGGRGWQGIEWPSIEWSGIVCKEMLFCNHCISISIGWQRTTYYNVF